MNPLKQEREREKVLLCDGNNLLSRATYAYTSRAPHADEDQHVSGAVMLWLNSLRRFVRSEKPDRVAVCFDPPERPQWRAEIMPSYKAERTTKGGYGAPVSYAVVLTHMLGLEPREHPEAEADDLVAGLAKVHADLDHDVVIVSADKDLLQCIGPRVSVLRPGVQPEWWDARQVEQRYGVPPAAMAAYQAMVGDTSDGVPGVRGIGKKRAQAILADVSPDEVSTHERIAKKGATRVYEDSLAVVTLPGCPERYAEALDPVPLVVGCRDAQEVTPTGLLRALGLEDEAGLVESGTLWD